MIEAAPKVEAAQASAARPRAAPDAAPAISSGRVATAVAPSVEAAVAEPPTERSSLVEEGAAATKPATPVEERDQQPMSVDALRATRPIAFDSPGAVIVGPVERNFCEHFFSCCTERSFISFGEVKRHVLIADGNAFIYTDVNDPSPLYTIPLEDLSPEIEDPSRPNFYSHTISPEANVGLPFDNQSKR